MNFKQFSDIINNKFVAMSNQPLFITNVPKEQLWATYQSAYTSGSNPIFRERRVHDCNTCYSFIKRLGAVVSITNNQLDTIWNVEGLEAPYAAVALAMHNLVSTSAISSIFLSDEKLAGSEFNIEENEAENIKWDHFYADISAFHSNSVAADRGEIETTITLFNRALTEFSVSTLETAIDLCDTIYRGTEFKPTVVKFLEAKRAFDGPLFIWQNYNKYPARIRNSAIGTLLIDIESGVELNEAVRKYEAVVAPSNYKRTTAVVTEGMKQQALATIAELGIEPSLARRHAILEDISINNVLFADRSAKSVMKEGLDNLLKTSKPVKAPTGATEITIEQFLTSVMPNSSVIEALVENKHTGNFVSLVAPTNPDSPNILKWDNNFTWSYNGEVTDSMKQNVKAAGGKVDGILRFSIQWNEGKFDQSNDLDAHCRTPTTHIYYASKSDGCGGQLDVDIQRPGNSTAVENITWNRLSTMKDGTYIFYVNNYSGANSKGFRAEVEYNGQLFEYTYNQSIRADVVVAEVTLHNGEFTIVHKLPCSTSSKDVWGTATQQYQRVSTIMLSPNFWDEQKIGNKHYFFMLDGCKNPSDVRGFYNEFLSDDLTKHRKVFEMISSLMKCEPSDSQLSGLGFSSTVPNTLSVKCDGRPYTITF